MNDHNFKIRVLQLLSEGLGNSKLSRLQAAQTYIKEFTYHNVGTDNITQILHIGQTEQGREQVIETITYVDPSVNGSKVIKIVIS